MLIEFSVSNYKSFGKKQTLSMEPVSNKKDSEKEDNKFTAQINAVGQKLKNVELLKSAVIYGANNAGKSNLLKAMNDFCSIVRSGMLSRTSEWITYSDSSQAFLLDDDFLDKPSEFTMVFILHNIKYSYSITTDFKEIISEELISFPKGSEKILIYRNQDTKQLKIGQRSKMITDSVHSRSLILTTAVRLNTDSKILSDVFSYISSSISCRGEYLNEGIGPEESMNDSIRSAAGLIELGNKNLKKIFINTIGEGIIDIKTKMIAPIKKGNIFPDYKIKLVRKNKDGKKIEFDLLENESLGTKKLFALLDVLDLLTRMSVIVIDELDSSIHPKLIESIVQYFHSKETNPKNTQLIFTTHNASLMGNNIDIFRRDQIWFVDKGYDNNTELYPLTDYYTRKGADFADYYLSGKYGAIKKNTKDL